MFLGSRPELATLVRATLTELSADYETLFERQVPRRRFRGSHCRTHALHIGGRAVKAARAREAFRVAFGKYADWVPDSTVKGAS